ncbi:phytanoyl-CoA dioxygenase family protein [Roseivirga sp. E12]|uniref:phytanoyl-CoA dioxygenase family protein n=1 Tax=Roseivirga sp. E12 TaxID=2819237 RepID=UPI001ABD1BAA|nr:phytanoyl-CoA dioxygenase family protein [Roseivirga sp. E12]MBO3699061.1 phytanoyl-CoA dioxygenase family protein [Roseivirga sp. E12]
MEFSPEEKRKGKINKERLASVVKEFRANGFLVIDNHFSKEKVEELNASFERDYSHHFEDKQHKDARRFSHKRPCITVNVKDEFNAPEIYCDPLILELMGHLLEPDFIICNLTCVLSLPGSKQMKVHRDGTIFNGSPVRSLLPPFAIGMLVPLIPFNKINGTTRFWPGSHLGQSTIEETAQSPNFIESDIDQGSCILMDYRLCHSGNANNSDTVRPLLYCNYSNAWYIDVGNFQEQAHFYLSDEEFMKIPAKNRKLFVRRNINLTSTFELLNN